MVLFSLSQTFSCLIYVVHAVVHAYILASAGIFSSVAAIFVMDLRPNKMSHYQILWNQVKKGIT